MLEDIGVFLGIVLGGGDQPGHHFGVLCRQRGEIEVVAQLAGCEVRPDQHVGDHPLETQLPTVVGGVDPGDAVVGQLLALGGEDGPSPAPKQPDVTCISLHQEVPDIAIKLHMATLIGSDRDGVGILFDGGLHDVEAGAVVPEMDDLGP